MRRLVWTLCLAAAAMSACGDDETRTLRVHSSLPHHGGAAEHARAIEQGARLALRQREGRAGKFPVEYVTHSDSTELVGNWDPPVVAENAGAAATDRSAIAYLGDFNSAATAIAMPILNEAPVAQVSPASTATGLTAAEPGVVEGEPESHYPSGERHFFRLAPRDTLQARALARLMREEGCASVAVVDDGTTYAGGLREALAKPAADEGLALTDRRGGSTCFLYLGLPTDEAAGLYDAVAAAGTAKLFGADALVEPPLALTVGPRAQRRLLVTAPVLAPDAYPPAGRRFFAAFRRAYDVRDPDPYAIYGYEAMAMVLDAIERAGDDGDDPAKVIERLFDTRARRSVLGTYDVLPTGDTTLDSYGVWMVRDGRAVFRRVLEAG